MIKQLQLKFSEVLQGEFVLKPLNMFLTFQVNCPGCFLYSLPMVQEIFKKHSSNELNVFALSTSFEDFELNTAENTDLLLREKTVVGETRKALAAQGLEKYPHPLDFTVLMDKLVERSKFLDEMNIEEFFKVNPSTEDLQKDEINKIKTEIANYFSRYEKIPYTFTTNQFAGTPTWVIFDEEYKVLAQWFGHKPLEETEWIIKSTKY